MEVGKRNTKTDGIIIPEATIFINLLQIRKAFYEFFLDVVT